MLYGTISLSSQVHPLYTQLINTGLPVSSTHPVAILLLFTGIEIFLRMSILF